jgi:histidinol-phosphatase (PHP family)
MNYDYHTHTFFSSDSDAPMEEMILSAISRGIKEYAITDHYDPGYYDPEFPFDLDFPEYWKSLLHYSSKYADEISIAKGIEIGIMEGSFKEADHAVSSYPFDFVIGSFHGMPSEDFYDIDFSSVENKKKYTDDFYMYMYRCLSAYDNYDVLGHFTILDRYIGELLDFTPFEDISRQILKMIIDKGKGIELNTSSFHYGSETWLPREFILSSFLELGGEILTIGSDAHSTKYQQHHFDESVDFLKSLGFRYYCTFKERKASFHSL